jgi:hypothetical protein
MCAPRVWPQGGIPPLKVFVLSDETDSSVGGRKTFCFNEVNNLANYTAVSGTSRVGSMQDAHVACVGRARLSLVVGRGAGCGMAHEPRHIKRALSARA